MRRRSNLARPYILRLLKFSFSDRNRTLSKLVEPINRHPSKTSVKDICHLSKVASDVPIMFCLLRLGTHMPKKLLISCEFCFQLHGFEVRLHGRQLPRPTSQPPTECPI